MLDSPDEEWRRLTAHYAGMWDDELLNLAADYKDLTEMAQQVLRDEMRKRKLGDPSAPISNRAPVSSAPPEFQPLLPGGAASIPSAREAIRSPMGPSEERELRRCRDHYAELADEDLEDLVAEFGDLTPMAQQALGEEMLRRGLGNPEVRAQADREESDDDTGSYDAADPLLAAAELRAQATETNEWWVRIFETDDRRLVLQYSVMLSNARILHRSHSEPSGGYVIEAAADQAEEAERVLSQPIPQSVIEESKEEVSEFEMPHCPRCHSQEPTLIGTEPSNQWHCDSCGNEWSDPVAAGEQG
jgi:hypothetical protein